MAGLSLHISVDPDTCIGAGQCAQAAPEVFDQREEDGTVVLLDADPPVDMHDGVREAVQRCPSSAIRETE